MIKKRVYPVIEGHDEGAAIVTETVAEYRIFGILIYKKTIEMPQKYGFRYYSEYLASTV
jgi:hypothetical protein